MCDLPPVPPRCPHQEVAVSTCVEAGGRGGGRGCAEKPTERVSEARRWMFSRLPSALRGPSPKACSPPQAGSAFAQLSASVSEVAPASWETTSWEPEGPRRGCGWWFLSMHKAKISGDEVSNQLRGWMARPASRAERREHARRLHFGFLVSRQRAGCCVCVARIPVTHFALTLGSA